MEQHSVGKPQNQNAFMKNIEQWQPDLYNLGNIIKPVFDVKLSGSYFFRKNFAEF